ncbi:MAG: hypothetical protein A2189_05590 [Paenibacillus sp. RIFOXYA1_FULL_44_5]|nr:MAG: hypothetical protein A2189_05590 [Paenibacillus sp. RIFOXYA1_FULL_44_5]
MRRLNWRFNRIARNYHLESEISSSFGALHTEQFLHLKEIRNAHREWECAINHFNLAVDKDEVDYTIYALEAAEKRYSMLLRQAKNMNLYDPHWIPKEN